MRAVTTRRSRWLRMARDTNSVTSRLAPSDQCTSSTTTTIGPRRAAVSRPSLIAPYRRPVLTGVAAGDASRGRRSSSTSGSTRPSRSRSTSIQGANGRVRPAASEHAPRATVQLVGSRASSSPTRRVLPIPASPWTSTTAGSPRAARAATSRRTASCSVRPTRGDMAARATCPWWHRDWTVDTTRAPAGSPVVRPTPVPPSPPTPAGDPCRGARTGRGRPGGG